MKPAFFYESLSFKDGIIISMKKSKRMTDSNQYVIVFLYIFCYFIHIGEYYE